MCCALLACHDNKSEDALPDAGLAPLDAASEPSADGDASRATALDAAAAGDATDEQRDALAGELVGPPLCARQGDDAVRDIFCKTADPGIRGLRELQTRLALTTIPLTVDDAAMEALKLEPTATIDSIVYLGHSTALAGQIVSPINPRAILIGYQSLLAFQRGVQQVELIALDRERSTFNFYLLTFAQTCNDKPMGCSPGDLYTPSIERNWTSLSLRDDEDLKNTPDDCRQCHQRVRDQPATLLIRERQGPWTHFFGALAPADANYGEVSNGELVQDYQKAKGLETYAGMPAAVMNHTAGGVLQARIVDAQPLEFDTPAIEAELGTTPPGQPRRSATWDRAYQAFKRGEQLALPHFEPRPTDPQKQAKLSAAYARYRAKEIGADALPDLADIFPDDPKVRAEIGLQTEPGATPAEALVQACAPCHNDVLDQSISRARFNIALSRMSREERELAITRIGQPKTEAGAMPPPGNRQLDPDAQKRLIEYLRSDQRPAADDAFLDTAAKVGMAKEPADYPRLF